MRLSAKEIAAYVNAEPLLEPANPDALSVGLAWDSREVAPGFVYVALPGARVDGHSFAGAALDAGANVILVSHALDEAATERARELGVAVYQVADTYAAVTELAAGWRTHLGGKVIALTGSTGKTTTKNLVRDVLATTFTTTATKGNQNNELGVPKTLLDAAADTQCVVVEMGMRGLGQLEELCRFVKPDLGLVTNCGECHIELLGSRENIARAKAEVVAALGAGATAVLNAADGMLDVVLEAARPHERGVEVVLFDGSGTPAEGASSFATDIKLDAAGCPSFTLHLPTGAYSCTMALRGAHNVHNACAAAGLAFALGVPAERIVAGLEASLPEAGRQEVLEGAGGITVINDAYNANPDSMKASLSMFSAMEVKGRRFACLGDMGELGDHALGCHEGVGTFLAPLPIDHLVCVGELSEHIAQAAIDAGFPQDQVFCTRGLDDALAHLKGCVREGDAVLCKASHSMELDKIAKGLLA